MLEQIEEILQLYKPNTNDEAKIKGLTERFLFMERRIAEMQAVESGSAQIPGIHARILNGGFDLSQLSPKDRALFPTIRLHPASSVQTKSFEDFTPAERQALRFPYNTVKVPAAKKTCKISIGWSSDQIKPALPEIFDFNLAQDLADFADSQVHVTWVADGGKTIYSNADTEVEIFDRRHDRKNMERAMNVFPILNQIVSLRKMSNLLRHRQPAYNAAFVDGSWPFPEGFTWEEKFMRYGDCRGVMRAELDFPTDLQHIMMYSSEESFDVQRELEWMRWEWELTRKGVEEFVEDIRANGMRHFKAFVKAQKEIKNHYREKGRNINWASVRDERGVLSMAKVKKVLKEEKKIAKIEDKHGIKRKLELKEGQTKAECKICKKHITKNYWEKHIDSKTHMQKALKLS